MVEGLPTGFEDFVSARVLEIASSVGAPTDQKPGCRTNVLIIFTPEPQALLDNVRRRHPEFLGFHYEAQAKRLATFNRPIQAWYVTGAKARGGNVELDAEFGARVGGNAASRLTAELRSQFLFVLVVVDSNKVAGHEIGAISDNVAMLSLARPAPPTACSELPSVLDAMNPDCPATGGTEAITIYDTAYLRALYSIDMEAFLGAQRSEITSRILRDLKARSP